jgi:dipeptidyl-peptidase-4
MIKARLRAFGPFAVLGASLAVYAPAQACFDGLAATRNYSLGLPQRPMPTPDGKHVLFLRSGPRDTKLGLYEYDLATRSEHALARPAASPEHLSTEEKALRERMRQTLTGITDYALSEDGATILASQAGKVATIALPGGRSAPVPGEGWIGPKLSPDGRFVAGVRDNDVHVVDLATGQDKTLTTGGTDVVTHGLPDFAAAEELDRADGLWWSPDGSQLLFEEADSTGVEKHFIADPEHPQVQPTEFRYPRAGTANATLRFGLIPRAGGKTTWVDWNRETYPYVARVVWQKSGPLSLVLLNRAQTAELVVSVDTATGKTTELVKELDSAWVNVDAQHSLGLTGGKPLPYWLADGSGFLWAVETAAHWRLELRKPDGSLDHVVTPPDLPWLALNDVDEASGTVSVTANPDRLGSALFRVPLAGGPAAPMAATPGVNDATYNDHQHGVLVVRFLGADGTAQTSVMDQDGKQIAVLPSVAEAPPAIPRVEFRTVGALGMDAAILRPTGARPGQKFPVVLYVYGGPTVKVVMRPARDYLENQCLADHGFIVVSVDGRGTPGRDRAWERATKYDFIDIPLQDQIDGLQALGAAIPEMDMSRVGITGWSFGGYFTAMATIRRPDVFKAGVAGAPVVDFDDYDTAYTERYLGLPQTTPDAYAKTNVLSYAAQLSRPLMIMHGLTDDNVYFQNSVKLTQALIAAGKPYQLLLLPGTHQLPDPKLRMRVDEARAGFLAEQLK